MAFALESKVERYVKGLIGDLTEMRWKANNGDMALHLDLKFGTWKREYNQMLKNNTIPQWYYIYRVHNIILSYLLLKVVFFLFLWLGTDDEAKQTSSACYSHNGSLSLFAEDPNFIVMVK